LRRYTPVSAEYAPFSDVHAVAPELSNAFQKAPPFNACVDVPVTE
jgi:hypothetical protein